MKVLVAAGRYDSLNNCAGNEEDARRLKPELEQAVTFKCYIGGHMMYRDQPSRLQFAKDVSAMIRAALRE